jgi:hypothetical protein
VLGRLGSRAATNNLRRAQAEGRCAVCVGSDGAPRSYAPTAVAEKLSEPRWLRRYLRSKLRASRPSASGRRVGRHGHFTNREFCERAIRRPMLEAAITYFIATVACAENDGLNVFGCSRLAAGIGFLRLPASSRSGVTGILTYARKPGGAQLLDCASLRCDTLPEVFPLNGCRPASTACALASEPAALSQGGFRCAIFCSRLAWAP